MNTVNLHYYFSHCYYCTSSHFILLYHFSRITFFYFSVGTHVMFLFAFTHHCHAPDVTTTGSYCNIRYLCLCLLV